MRMWMVEPKIMCRKHLLGEHVEIHMFVGTLNAGISVAGYVDNGLLHGTALASRHDELVAEMKRRGYKHNSPLPPVAADAPGVVDAGAALVELIRRCPQCRENYFALSKQKVVDL